MAVSVLSRLAVRAAAPVLAVAGAGGASALAGLRARDGLRVVASPRHATVLVVAGAVPPGLIDVIGRLHDQLPHPRGVVWWRAPGGRGRDDAGALGLEEAVTVEPAGDVAGVARRVHDELVGGRRASSPPVGPAANPVAWQGLGDHGQGGEGMMGGQPYGRPMAMTGEDVRDGLALDRVALPVGPALPGLPAGLRLELELQGDVIAAADVAANPFAGDGWAGARLPSAADPFDAARVRPVWIAELETARARWHLLALSQGLALHGLAAGARRVARLAVRPQPPAPGELGRVRRWLLGAPAMWGAAAGVGRIAAERVGAAGLTGVAARAAGHAVDARAHDPAYQALGFTVRTRGGDGDAGGRVGRGHIRGGAAGDARARWRQRVDEAEQALALAAAAGEATAGPNVAVEDPRGDSAALLRWLPAWLVGLEWGDALATIASLDLDLEVAAGRAPVPAPGGAPAPTREAGP